MSFEDLLLIGGILMALAVFSGSHAHAAHTGTPACTADAVVVSQIPAAR